MIQKVEYEKGQDSILNKLGVVMLLIISFFIGLKQLNVVFLMFQIAAVLCILISGKRIDRSQHMLPVVALLCIVIIICNRNTRLLRGSYSFLLDLRICTGFLFYFMIDKSNWTIGNRYSINWI